MNPSKSSAVDDAQESASLRTRPEESSDFLSGETITSDSGIPAEPSYIDRKTRSAQGIWGRVKEMPNGCWEWQGGVNDGGYGRVGVNRKTWIVSRLVFTVFNGEIPDGVLVLHTCDNPPCCNPRHLFLGTNSDNLNDCRSKSRRPRGHSRVLNERRAAEIRKDYEINGGSHREMAERHRVNIKTMAALLNGVTWYGVPVGKKPILDRQKRDYVRRLYAEGGISVRAVAEHMGVKSGVIRGALETPEREEPAHGR